MNFEGILEMNPGPERTAALVGWFQGLFEDRSAAPVLVGGAAVELYTGGAYLTGDLDFVGYMTEEVARSLSEVGFRRTGRHWKHEEGQLFIEIPGSFLEGGARSAELDAFGEVLRVISPEDALVDRLAGWKFWKSHEHGVNAYLLYRALGEDLDISRLEERARTEHVLDAWNEVVQFAKEIKGREATEGELREWAKRNL
ncbi:MAG: hypothetical protein ACREK7_05395 [Gemmatimonadota bacterium]